MNALPDLIEICARVLNGRVCGSVLYLMANGVPYCYKCGSNQPGIIYATTGSTREELNAERVRTRVECHSIIQSAEGLT